MFKLAQSTCYQALTVHVFMDLWLQWDGVSPRVYCQLFQERSYKSVKVNTTMSKVIMGNDMVLHLIDWGATYFGIREGRSTNTGIHAFSFLLAKHRGPQPSSTKLLLPIIPIGIVTCDFVLSWDDLSRNNCINCTYDSILHAVCSTGFLESLPPRH